MTDKEETNFVQSPDEITAQRQTELAFNKSGQNLESAKEKVYGKVVAKNSREHK